MNFASKIKNNFNVETFRVFIFVLWFVFQLGVLVNSPRNIQNIKLVIMNTKTIVKSCVIILVSCNNKK